MPRLPVLLVALLFLAVESRAALAAEANYESLIDEALRQRDAGQFQAAERNLRQAMALAGETNEAAYLLGMVLAFQEDFTASLAVLNEALLRYPNDVQLILARARVLSFQGQYQEAIDVARQVLAQAPGNSDARNLLARVYYYQSRYPDSAGEFLTTLEYAPDNLEALLGLHDVYRAVDNEARAEEYLQRATLIAPASEEVLNRQVRDAAPEVRHHELIAGGVASDFDLAGLSRWYDRFLEYRHHFDSGTQLYLRGEHNHRFGTHDSLVEVGLYLNRGAGLPLELAVAHSGDNEFMPSERIRIGTSLLLNQASAGFGSTTLGISLARSEYQTGDVNIGNLLFTHYLLNVNAWLTPGLIFVEDENGDSNVGFGLGGHWQATPRWLLGYNFTDAAETENNITTDTRAHHVYARYQITDRSALRLDLSDNARDNSYTRQAVALSLQLRF